MLELFNPFATPGLIFYCVGGIFHWSQTNHLRHFRGASQQFRMALELSCSVNWVLRLVFLGLTWYSFGFFAVIGAFLMEFLFWSVFNIIINHLLGIPDYVLSLLGFVVSPAMGALMIYAVSTFEVPDVPAEESITDHAIEQDPIETIHARFEEVVGGFNQQAPVEIDQWTSMDSLAFDRDSMIMTYYSTMRGMNDGSLLDMASAIPKQLESDYAEGGQFAVYEENGVAVRLVYFLEHRTHWKTFQYPRP